MNILFINTWRIGDTLMSWHLVQSLQKKYPHSAIDYLTFDNSKVLQPLLQSNVNFHYISHSSLQSMSADVDVSLFRAFEELEKELRPILNKKYDLVINYSNTKISTYITSMVSSLEYVGSHYNTQKVVNYGSKWIEYLDVKCTEQQGGYFHFNEIFSNALDLPIEKNLRLHETNTGIVEIKKYLNTNQKIYVLQLFTSETKKDFPQDKLNALLTRLNQELAGKFLLLCMSNSPQMQIPLPIENAQWVPCSMEGAYSLLQSAEALITVDTSIKHLASFTNTKIIELCFGSSRPQQTGAFKTNGLVVQAKEYCYPCKHSSACSREATHCSIKVNEHELAKLIADYLQNRPLEKTSSFDYSTIYLDGRHYILQEADSIKVRENILTKLSWIYHLSQKLNSEVHELIHFFIEEISGLSFERLDQNLIFLQRELEDTFRKLKVGNNLKDFVEDQRFINLQSILKNLNLDFKIPNSNNKIDFAQTRFMQNQLQELLGYLSSYRKLSQDILSEAKYYERTNSKNITI
jgi:ADP-heptose:LPS heptosyltransferase